MVPGRKTNKKGVGTLRLLNVSWRPFQGSSNRVGNSTVIVLGHTMWAGKILHGPQRQYTPFCSIALGHKIELKRGQEACPQQIPNLQKIIISTGVKNVQHFLPALLCTRIIEYQNCLVLIPPQASCWHHHALPVSLAYSWRFYFIPAFFLCHCVPVYHFCLLSPILHFLRPGSKSD